jgi:ribonuclease R
MANTQKKSKRKTTKAPNHKEKKLYQNLLRVTLQFMKGKGFTGASEAELKERLSIHSLHDEVFHQVLQDLLKEESIEVKQGIYKLKKSPSEVVTGILRVHPRGFGFLQPSDPTLFPEDIFIPKHLTQNAVDGDTVEVLINLESISEKGPEGRVITILQRGRTHLAGIICEVEIFGDIIAYVPLLGTSQRVVVQPSQDHSLVVGDRVVMEVTSWGSKETETQCRVSHVIGHISDPSCDIPAAIEEYELRSQFPIKAIREAEKMSSQVSTKDIKAREDIRHIECFTIDPDTAKDFDDAVSLTKDDKGHYHLGVHIADVSHYVRPGSALDTEAKER